MSPDGIEAVIRMFLDIDVRHVLPTLHVPTLVLHRHGDRVVNRRAAQWMAEQIRARFVDLPGRDHFPWVGDSDAIVEEVREFLTGGHASRTTGSGARHGHVHRRCRLDRPGRRAR